MASVVASSKQLNYLILTIRLKVERLMQLKSSMDLFSYDISRVFNMLKHQNNN